MFKRGKTEEREINESRREHQIEKEALQLKMEELRDENDYLNTKISKIEATNKELRLARSGPSASAESKKYEAEI